MCFCPCSCQTDIVSERRFVCAVGVCVADLGYVFVSVSACECFAVCLFLSELSCLFSHKEGTAVAVHYRERDCGRLEFSWVCLRLGPLLNEEFSILLIMLLWLMSLFADSEECNKTFFCLGFLPLLIGLNKRAFHASTFAIVMKGSGWHLCVFSAFTCMYFRLC